jgi:diguanylate cyclase (GGDEF)-like protein
LKGMQKTQTNKTPNDPVQAAKRLIFLIATPLGVVSLSLIWGISYSAGALSWLDLYTIPTLAFSLLILFSLLWSRRVSIQFFEIFTYILLFLYFSLKFASLLRDPIYAGSQIEMDFVLWIPFIYILGFIMLDIRRALIGSIAFFIITLLLGSIVLVKSFIFGNNSHNVSLLIEIIFASLLYIIILYMMARLREHYVTSQVMAEVMSKLAMTDSLTQVDNRRRLEKYIDEEVKRSDRHHLPLVLIMFDIDNFKRINDRFGHSTGDMVLVNTARLIKGSLRGSDHFGRWGGDEFICLATNTDEDTAIHLAERLRKELEQAKIMESFPVTGSFGLTRFVRGDTTDILVRRADLGLLRAKVNGRNQVVVIPPETTLLL